MAKPIRAALVNDYMIVLEGLRALLAFAEPAIQVVEMDVRTNPKRRVDVTLLDTYGELTSLRGRVRSLSADPSNGAVLVFSFSDSPEAVRRSLARARWGSSPRPSIETRSSRPLSRRLEASASC